MTPAPPLAPAASAPAPSPDPTPPATAPAPRPGARLWPRVGLALALLAASGAARDWQSRRIDRALRDGRASSFPLESIPMNLGDWEGRTTVMDPQIVGVTGATDSVFRSYQHRRTGQRVEACILFGPSIEMYGHGPEVCFPTNGFAQVAGPDLHAVPSGAAKIPFRSLVYARAEGGGVDRDEVYYSWFYSGRWSPDLVTPKEFMRIPGMYKVHVERHILKAGEMNLRGEGNPSEAFLAALMPEIDARIARGARPSAPAPAPSPRPAPGR